jgi:hypothetical protein
LWKIKEEKKQTKTNEVMKMEWDGRLMEKKEDKRNNKYDQSSVYSCIKM